MNTFRLVLIFCLFSSRLCAQIDFQAGLGMHYDVVDGNAILQDSIRVGAYSGAKREMPSGYIAGNFKVLPKLSLEMGMNLHSTIYSMYADQFTSQFGAVRKVSHVKSFIVSAPLNLKFKANKFLYFKGGFVASFVSNEDIERFDFQDMPALSDPLTQVSQSLKIANIGYGVGTGMQVRKFDLGYYFTSNISSVTKPISIADNRFSAISRLAIHHIQLTYHLSLNRKS